MAKVKHTIKKPTLIKMWMKFFGYRGLTTPWNTIYYMSRKDQDDKRLVRHELKHIEQMEREGKFKFLVKYNYYWLRYGYKNNPYEMEARKAENVPLGHSIDVRMVK